MNSIGYLEVSVSVPNTITQICGEDLRRRSIRFFTNAGGGQTNLWPYPGGNASQPPYVIDSTTYVDLLYKDWGAIVTGPWWAVTPGGVNIVNMLTVRLI